MELQIKQNEYGIRTLNIKYQSEEVDCDLGEFFRLPKDFDVNNNGMFSTINRYLSTLPKKIRDEVFNTYKEINAEDNLVSYNDVTNIRILENEIARISHLLNYENFKAWFKVNDKDILYPPDLKDVFIYDPDMNTTLEKTYVKEEYKNLIALILFIRMLSPMYLNFCTYIKNLTPHYYYKLFMLFNKSEVYHSEELKKLEVYIEANQLSLTGTANNKNDYHILNSGLSDDDMVGNLISTVIFNKLMSIDFTIKDYNVVSFIFQTIRYKSNYPSQDGLSIRAKKSPNDTKEDASYFEDYRKISAISIGTIVELQHALSDMPFIIQTLCPNNFDLVLYEKELKMIGDYNDYRLSKLQIYLLGWFLNKIINPRALYYIEYRKLVELTLFAKVTLLQNNQPFLAGIFGSYKTEESGYVNVVIRNTIGKHLISRLEKNYSFALHEVKQSVIEKTIAETSKEITSYLWKPIGYTNSIESVINSDGYLTIPNNLNDLICDYIDFVNN
jgi:hypothetical protein